MAVQIHSREEAQLLMKLAVDAGQIMLVNGGEIYRVEDSIKRILESRYPIEDIEVVCTYSSIMVTFYYQGESITSIRKIHGSIINLNIIHQVNQFSRDFVQGQYSLDQARRLLKRINNESIYPPRLKVLVGALGASLMTFTLNGTVWDALATLTIILFTQFIIKQVSMFANNQFIETMLNALFITLFAGLIQNIPVEIHPNVIIIGGIYLLFPGVALTNSVRDFMNNDLVSGVLGLSKAFFIAAALAAGVVIVIHFIG